MLFKRISILLCPLLILGGLELLFYQTNLIYFLLAIMPIILFFFLKILIKEKLLSWNFWALSCLPILFLFATIGFLLILSSDFFSQLIIIIFSLILLLYLENIFIFYYKSWHYQIGALENFSSFLCLLTFFLLAINLNAFNVFINYHFGYHH